MFKALLDKFWQHQQVVFDFKAEVTGTGNLSEFVFTALHGMQRGLTMRFLSVRLSVRLLNSCIVTKRIYKKRTFLGTYCVYRVAQNIDSIVVHLTFPRFYRFSKIYKKIKGFFWDIVYIQGGPKY